MHHLIYSEKDAYISNKKAEQDKNFGLDEMLIIGVSHSYNKVLKENKVYYYNETYICDTFFRFFTGELISGSIDGRGVSTASFISGTYNKFTCSLFSGSLSGSIDGYETGSLLSANDFSGSLENFSGSINSVFIEGWQDGYFTTNGKISTVSGSFSLQCSTVSGYTIGTAVKNELNYVLEDEVYKDRSLIKFDLTAISESISNGEIINPTFTLKLKSTDAKELLVPYTIYAFPISQSWVPGHGYWSDNGGSDEGVNWYYRDYNNGIPWYYPYSQSVIPPVDYLNDYDSVTASFERGGGTWYDIPCTQSFGFESSDINLDVSPIVYAWLSGSIPNEGFVLIYSREINDDPLNSTLWYFSKETNTIYSPKLDVSWEDSKWETGSIWTGSVGITTYPPGISGSIVNGYMEVTKSYIYDNTCVSSSTFQNFNGIFTGSFVGIADVSGSIVNYTSSITDESGSIIDTSNRFTCSLFSGSIVGNVVGEDSGVVINTPNYVGWLTNFSGSVIAKLIDGFVTGSVKTETFYKYTGTIATGSGIFSGNATGTNMRTEVVHQFVTGVIATGSFYGTAYLIFTDGYCGYAIIEPGSFVNLYGESGTIRGLNITGYVTGISSVNMNGARYVTASLYTGEFSGSQLFATYGFDSTKQYTCEEKNTHGLPKETYLRGFLSGSFGSNFFVGKAIIGTPATDTNPLAVAYQYSSLPGEMMGEVVSGSWNGGIFIGMATSGVLTGARMFIPFTGSFSYLTSSYSFTSSVDIVSSSLQSLDTEKPFVVIIQDLKKTYSSGDFPKIRVFAREQFPLKTFQKSTQQPTYITPKVLPTSSYYGIKDNETEEMVIDFDNYTKLSCEPSGSYFYLDTTSFEQERYYRVMIRVNMEDGKQYTFDSTDLFKVIR